MGVQEIFSISPVVFARDLIPGLGNTIAASDERLRRQEAADRRMLYQDKPESVVKRLVVNAVFDDATVRARMHRFVPLTVSQALFKRTVNEVARTAYMVPPTRRILPAGEQENVFAALADEIKINYVMDCAARMAVACNASFLVPRFVARLGRIVIDVVAPDLVTVIPDPEDPLSAVAYIYDKQVWDSKKKCWVTWRVYWDDQVTFQFDETGAVREFPGRPGEPIVHHGYRRIPIVAIHACERFSEYWNYSTGRDLMYAHLSDVLLQLLALRKLKAQGFRKLVVSGDMQGFPKGQIFDEEAAILAPTGTSVTDLASEADAANYMALQTDIKQNASANRGISRKRLNAEGPDSGDDLGLMEQRSEVIKFMMPAEHDLLDVLQMLSSKHHPNFQLADGIEMSIDYGEIPHRMDRKAVLEIREMEKSAGIRNVLDDVMEDNPECISEAMAEGELQRNVDVQSKWVEKIRALNISKTADASKPGQSPEENGKLGPQVRDGEISKDAAAAKAEGVDVTKTAESGYE
jgi:hypothetical protein